MKKLSWLLIVVIIFSLASVFTPISFVNDRRAYASGTANITCTIPAVAYTQYFAAPTNTTDDLWSNCVATETPDSWTAATYQVWTGWSTKSNANEFTLYWGGFTFDVSSLPEGVEIVSAAVDIYSGTKNSDYSWEQQYALYTGDPVDPTTWVAGDGNNWDYVVNNPNRVSNLYDYDDVGGSQYYRFTLNQGDFATGDFSHIEDAISGNCSFYLMTANHAMKSAPTWVDTKVRKANWNVNPGAANPPKLYITYVEGTPERVVRYNQNAAVDVTVDGSEVADNITWDSPRCAYSDDTNGLYFVVNGESGAVIDLVLKDGNGIILAEHEDSIRVDGKYNWLVDLPNSWYGYVRAYEMEHNLHTEWGYSMPSPSSTQLSNMVYAYGTSYPQYDNPFSYYITYQNEVFVLHWRTNIQEGELSDHDLWITANGDNATKLYENDFQTLNDDYFLASDNNSYLDGWRYALFSPNITDSGFDDMDGLIIDMEDTYTMFTSGFMQGLIVDTTDNSTLADSHSCYWYLSSLAQGLAMTLDKSSYNQAEDITLSINVGHDCKVFDNLQSLTIQVINSSGNVLQSSYHTVIEGANTFIMEAPATPGNHEIRLTFSGEGTWDYIKDIPFTVKSPTTATDADDILGQLETGMSNLGWWTDFGKAIIVLIAMIVLFIAARRSEIMRVLLPMMVLVAAIIADWVPVWIIVILTLGAGITVYQIFRKKVQGDD